MKNIMFALGLIVFTGGCGETQAAAPDASNVDHCMASFNYTAYWFNKGTDQKSLRLALTTEAMMLYTLGKIKAEAREKQSLQESTLLTKRYATQPKVMDALFKECDRAVRKDREFMDRQAYWLREARRKSARCARDANCRVVE